MKIYYRFIFLLNALSFTAIAMLRDSFVAAADITQSVFCCYIDNLCLNSNLYFVSFL